VEGGGGEEELSGPASTPKRAFFKKEEDSEELFLLRRGLRGEGKENFIFGGCTGGAALGDRGVGVGTEDAWLRGVLLALALALVLALVLPLLPLSSVEQLRVPFWSRPPGFKYPLA
jgi:predicted outer membrane lipoprotein